MEILLQSTIHTQIMCCTWFTKCIIVQAAELVAEADLVLDLVGEAQYYDDARSFLVIRDEMIRHVTEYYFEQEAYLADITADDDKTDHYYGASLEQSHQ